jgi:hypothetical protein
MESTLQVGPAALLLEQAAAVQAREDAESVDCSDDGVPGEPESGEDSDDGLGEPPPADETPA